MRPDCVQAVSKALGRQINQAEARGIEERIARHMRGLARREREDWQAMSTPDRLRRAGEEAARELVAEAQLKQRRVALQVSANQRIRTYLDDRAAAGVSAFDALQRLLVFHADTKGRTLSVESQARAIERDALRQMIDTLEASSPRWLGLFEDADGLRALVREMFGEDSGSGAAKAGAKAWAGVSGALRERFNRAGGAIGRIEDWGMPHHHSQMRVATAGLDTWLSHVMGYINRSRYLNDDGRPMDDGQVVEFLTSAWRSIATNGALDDRTVGSGRLMVANRRRYHREIHFKDANSYIEYQERYGDRGLYDVLVGHVQGVARDISLAETLGPNADAQYQLWRAEATRRMVGPDARLTGRAEKLANRTDGYFNFIAGRQPPVASEALARTFDTLRNWLVSSRLGSAVVTSIIDEATMVLSARALRLPQLQLWANELSALNPANQQEKRLALRAGLAMNGLISDLNRFGADYLDAASASAKIAGATLRASGLTAMTDARRRAFGRTMLSAIGHVTREFDSVRDLEASDRRILAAKGITEADFAVWKKAGLEDWGDGNDTMLTPDAIQRIPDTDLAALGDPQRLREQAITRLLGVVLEETDVAIIEPGARERAMMVGGLQRGTWKGELTRSFFLFKSFPIAMVVRHLGRAWDMPTGTARAVYLSGLIAGTTVLGAAATQISELLAGRDPRNMAGGRFWGQAMLKGGALGLYGDFLFSDTTQYGQTRFATLAGPVAGLVESIMDLPGDALMRAARGEDPRLGAELVKFGRANLPGANLWYAKAALDHLIVHQLQEMASPGYINAVRARGMREFQQRWWWEPGETVPRRAPDLEAALGGGR